MRKPVKTVTTLFAVLVVLQGCSPPQQNVFHDPYEQFALGKVYDCGDIQQTDYRLNHANSASPSFGCSHQSNLSLMIVDPADLTRPREMTPADEVARLRVLNAYREGGDTTAAPTARGTRALIQ